MPGAGAGPLKSHVPQTIKTNTQLVMPASPVKMSKPLPLSSTSGGARRPRAQTADEGPPNGVIDLIRNK